MKKTKNIHILLFVFIIGCATTIKTSSPKREVASSAESFSCINAVTNLVNNAITPFQEKSISFKISDFSGSEISALESDLAKLFDAKLSKSTDGIVIHLKDLSRGERAELQKLKEVLKKGIAKEAREIIASLLLKKQIADLADDPILFEQLKTRVLTDGKSFTGYLRREYLSRKTSDGYISIGLGYEDGRVVNIDILARPQVQLGATEFPDVPDVYLRFDRDQIVSRDCPHCVQLNQCAQCHNPENVRAITRAGGTNPGAFSEAPKLIPSSQTQPEFIRKYLKCGLVNGFFGSLDCP